MLTQPLLGLHGVVFRLPERPEAGGTHAEPRLEIGPIHLTLHRHERVLLDCESDAIYDAFLRVLSSDVHLIQGRLVEHERIRLQTDRHLREGLNLNRSIRELNAAGPLPDSIWLGGRRRSLFTVMDRLGILTHHVHGPLKMEPAGVFEKYWALRFVMSEADLLIGREIFALDDPAIREVIALRWGDLRGALIYAGAAERIPAPPHWTLGLHADGRATVEGAPRGSPTSNAGQEPGDGGDSGSDPDSKGPP